MSAKHFKHFISHIGFTCNSIKCGKFLAINSEGITYMLEICTILKFIDILLGIFIIHIYFVVLEVQINDLISMFGLLF